MAGHNKWAQIKRQKGKTDAERSKVFSKFARLITVEAKRSGGNKTAPGLKAVMERARAANMPNDNIERAIKKATEAGTAMENITYEAYGPGGSALIIETLTDNRNKAAQEVKAILSKHGFSLAGIGAATWAFEKAGAGAGGWIPKTTLALSDKDLKLLDALVSELEENDDVQEVFTNVE